MRVLFIMRMLLVEILIPRPSSESADVLHRTPKLQTLDGDIDTAAQRGGERRGVKHWEEETSVCN